MCKAREIFCRRDHCYGVVGWHILQPCPGSYLADCVADHFFDNTRWNWLAYTSGCKVPEVESRRRCKIRCCIDCFWTVMKDAMAHVDDSRDKGDAQGLFMRRLTRAKEQGRDLLCEVGLRGCDDASEVSSTAAGSERDMMPYERTPQTRTDTALLATDHNSAAAPAGFASAEGQTYRHGTLADAACADGPGDLDESLLMAAAASPSVLLGDELVQLPDLDSGLVDLAHMGGAAASAAGPSPGLQAAADSGLQLNADLGEDLNLENIDLGLNSDPAKSLGRGGDSRPANVDPGPAAASAEGAQLQFPWEGDVLDQSDGFWDVLVGPDDGSMAYIFGNEGVEAAGTKRQWVADEASDAWEYSCGGPHKKHRP